MASLQSILILLIAANFLAVFVIFNKNKQENPITETLATFDETHSLAQYRFDDPVIAYYLLDKLDVFEDFNITYLDDLIDPSSLKASPYKYAYYGFSTDDNYCKKHRAYFVDHSEWLFFDRVFLSDYLKSSMMRNKIIPMLGQDVLPNVTGAMPDKLQALRTNDVPLNINLYFVNSPMHIYRQIGKNCACISQTYNHVPGHSNLNRKDSISDSAIAYAKRFEGREQCFNFDKFFPKTWNLQVQEECEDFFKLFNGPEYTKLKEKRRIVFIRKVGAGAHKAKGVEPVNEKEEASLRNIYKNGTRCGKEQKNYVIQQFIHNPLLIDGHKFDFRIYMTVASTNPVIAYYHDGFLRLSLHQYDVNSNDKSVLLTNTDLSVNAFKKAKNGTLISGMNETELRNFQMWNFTKLHDYLLNKTIVKDSNWLDTHLRPEFRKAMVHLIRMAQHSFLPRSQVAEIFGVDFMLDENLNLWFIECNTSPVIKGTSEEKERFLTKMLKDHFDILTGLLRSRMKRVINYINRLTPQIKAEDIDPQEFYVPHLKQRRAEFKELVKNKFEPEFEPSKDNGFFKIVDENLQGTERYSNLISKECL